MYQILSTKFDANILRINEQYLDWGSGRHAPPLSFVVVFYNGQGMPAKTGHDHNDMANVIQSMHELNPATRMMYRLDRVV